MDILGDRDLYLCNREPNTEQPAAPHTLYRELTVILSAGFACCFHLQTHVLTLALNVHPSRSAWLIYLGIDDVP